MSKHTDGPWSVEQEEIGGEVTSDLCVLGPSPSFRYVASVSRCFQGDRTQEMEQANAHLIAAAPELLAALQTAEMAMLGYTHRNAVIAKALKDARAAIALATGNQS